MAKSPVNTNTPGEDMVSGQISLGYNRPDYSKPTEPGETPGTHTVYPSIRVCGAPAAALKQALNTAKLLDGDFAAIVVLKNVMVRTADEDVDEDPNEDVELEFVVKSILPSVDEAAGETEEDILKAFDALPAPKVEPKDAEGEDDDEE